MARIKCPMYSATYTTSLTLQRPAGPLKAARVPAPLVDALTPLPASVLTFQKQGGCAASPGTVQAVAGEQGTAAVPPPAQYAPMGHCVHAAAPGAAEKELGGQGNAGAGVPPGQKNPAAQRAGLALVEPAGQPEPGAALQAPLQEEKVRPVADP